MPGGTRSQPANAARKAPVRSLARTRNSTLTERSESPANALRTTAGNVGRPQSGLANGMKRKERDFEQTGVERTNINVVVRCRGRNDREVRENSGVVVSTEGVQGKSVELSMGPNAMGNKAYQFDKVFSPAADQAIIFDDVVVPILNDMLSGYNCTIFAYGQTGTGKTYTMSGDMSDTLGILSDAAGIIPRVLYALFHKLEDTENTVKCSFLELYNEELRDLLSSEDGTKLKIYEDGAKRGFTSTMVQGMGETYINSASAGIKLLQAGSHRRQVAATKCNDLSSRSHTVFTITAYIKRTTEKGEEYISSGKLNLVDLAGSENIQRSGAENKRAAEAGLINKSLLTLGRVINALVDGSPHIPYRESKLTRLLQDSLGGHTKTCIIATVSPARSNMEETISTLDYAFRAKNIRNKPQISSTISKKTLLREFTVEIEKLKSDLISTRQRNGVYLSPDTYEEMTVESESRRILTEEQRAKIETMEANLKHKVQELFVLTSNFNNLKLDNEQTASLLEKTDSILKATQQSLDEESVLRKAHEMTESELRDVGESLLSTLNTTVRDVDGLHSKLRRRSDLHAANRETWNTSSGRSLDLAKLVDTKVADFQSQHSKLLTDISNRMGAFISCELERIGSDISFLASSERSFGAIDSNAREVACSKLDEMNEVLEEIKVLREDVKLKVGEGLDGLSSAAARISDEVIHELEQFHSELRTSYTSLGDDLKNMFEILREDLHSQQQEATALRRELQRANQKAAEANESARSKLQVAVEEEKQTAEKERENLLCQIKTLLDETGERQAARFSKKVDSIKGDMDASHTSLRNADAAYGEGMDRWDEKKTMIVEKVMQSEESLRKRMEEDWNAFGTRNTAIQNTTRAVHEETVRIVNAQMEDIAGQMQALDSFVTRARSQNDSHHESHMESLDALSSELRQTYFGLRGDLEAAEARSKEFEDSISQHKDSLGLPVTALTKEVREPLGELQSNIRGTSLAEYSPTGKTPKKVQYSYPTTLPATEDHETILARLRRANQPSPTASQLSPTGLECGESTPDSASLPPASPTKTLVYNDAENEVGPNPPPPAIDVQAKPTSSSTGLRELDINVARPLVSSVESSENTDGAKATLDLGSDSLKRSYESSEQEAGAPPAKRQRSVSADTKDGIGESKLPQKIRGRRNAMGLGLGMIVEGGENIPLSALPKQSNISSRGRRLRSNP